MKKLILFSILTIMSVSKTIDVPKEGKFYRLDENMSEKVSDWKYVCDVVYSGVVLLDGEKISQYDIKNCKLTIVVKGKH